MKISWSAIRLRSREGAAAHDLMMIPAAWLGALWLRFNLGSIPAEFLDQALRLLPVVVVVQGSVFFYFGLYRGMWRFASLRDLVQIVQAVAIGACACATAAFLLTRMNHVPRGSFPVFAVLLVVLLSGPRIAYRLYEERRLGARAGTVVRTVLIAGAGKAGEALARTLLRDASEGYHPVGFVDDDPRKQGREVHGLRVLGRCERIPEIAARVGADLIAIAIPSGTAAQMRRLAEICGRANVPVQAVPGVQDYIANRSRRSHLRDLTIEDLLDRSPARPDWSAIRRELAAHLILVTGGGGSIGSELCRQIASIGPSRLIVLDVNEFNLHRIHRELRDTYPSLPVSNVLADVCDAAAIRHVFERHRPDIVFHTAAYKQVPVLEDHLREAVRVNALGTHTLAQAAMEHGAGRFVLVSSDKAVNPTNAMGASKRLAETICRASGDASPRTRFITVRFGNVLDSAGSVLPLFREQIARGGPVTVTDPEMERYFMTIPEACQLVMTSASFGEGGEVFVLDMGEPVRIHHLAERLIHFSGKVPGEDVAIEFIGSRPGEKLSEQLFDLAESPVATHHDKILLARSQPVRHEEFVARLAELRTVCDAFDEPALRRLFAELVPGYPKAPSSAGAASSEAARSPGAGRQDPAGGGGLDEGDEGVGNVVPFGRTPTR